MTPLIRRSGTLLLCGGPVAVAVALQFAAPQRHTLIFWASILAIVPLAGSIGQTTEELADQLGGAIGGLLNASFGNIAELIIGTLALRNGLTDLVKASLTGSIIGNSLLVFGLCALVGGARHRIQRFDRTVASLSTTMLLLSAIGLAVPAIFHVLSRPSRPQTEQHLDAGIALVLMVTYCASLLFTLKTHRKKVDPPRRAASGHSVSRSVMMLLVATAGVAWMSELLVGAVTDAIHALGITQLFAGVVILAVIGNAAEHYSAVRMAYQNKMDAALNIAVGSSTQIALFVTPVLVFISYVIAPTPMDLLFTVFEVVAVALAVLTISLIAHDGETHWMEGVQLLAVYVILALAFYFLPAQA